MQFTKREVLYIFVFFLTVTTLSYTYVDNVFASTTQLEHTKEINHSQGHLLGYDLENPSLQVELPKVLHEISGLTDIDNQTIACVQDEEGIVYIYDLTREELISQFEFDKEGDYEGITRVGDNLYILRSDGQLFEVTNYTDENFQVREYDLDIPIEDNEGLAYDFRNNQLLIAGKSEPKGDEYKNKKIIFAFDLNTKRLIESPVYEFSEEQIKEFIIANNTDLPEEDRKGKLKIHPSGIAIHPVTEKLFVLSSKDDLIYIFDSESEIESIFHLDKKIFNQPEGITFLDNGELLISNEGGKGEPTLLFFPFEQ